MARTDESRRRFWRGLQRRRYSNRRVAGRSDDDNQPHGWARISSEVAPSGRLIYYALPTAGRIRSRRLATASTITTTLEMTSTDFGWANGCNTPVPIIRLQESGRSNRLQLAKLRTWVCRKLRLSNRATACSRRDAGGGLAVHMARRYGVSVKAFNLSGEQIAFARDQAVAQGLADRVEFIEDDYRNVSGRYDVFVSVGMLEHVGLERFPELGRTIDRALTSAGRGLLHSIGRNRPCPLDPWTDKHIFPGAYPPSLREMLAILEPIGFSVLDVENLRLHYVRTLSHWLERFETAAPQVSRMFDDKFVRMWRMYLAGSISTFETGGLQLFQVVFARESNNVGPLTRDHLILRGSRRG